MKRLLVLLLSIFIALGMSGKAFPTKQALSSLGESISISAPMVGHGMLAKVGGRSYYGTLVDVSNAIKDRFGWENLSIENTRRNAIWSSVGLIGVLFVIFIAFMFSHGADDRDFPNQKHLMTGFGKEQVSSEKKRLGYKDYIFLGSFLLLPVALIVQNIMAVQYLVTAKEFDFMVFGHTPFWQFVGAFVAIAAVIVLVFLYNVGLTALSLGGFGNDTNDYQKALYGFVLPVLAYVLMMLSSLLNFIHINLLPFSFKVLRLGGILLFILAVYYSIKNKGIIFIAIPYGLTCGFSMICLGIIIAFYLDTLSLLAVITVLGGLGISLALGGGGLALHSSGGDKTEENVPYFSMDNLENTYKTDADGNEIFKSKSDGKYYVSKGIGYHEIDEP